MPMGVLRVLAAALCAGGGLLALVARPDEVAAAPAPFRVVVDAGHGGADPGALSPLLRMAEKDVALDVALRLGTALQQRGIQVVQTRTGDRDVGLAERAATAARVGAQALVSVHLNAAPTSAAASGAEGWHGTGERGAELAAALLDGLAGQVRRYGISVRGTRAGEALAVLRTPVPAALIELGYVTNPTDANALSQPGVREAAAQGLAEGLVRFRDGRTQARPQLMLATMGGDGGGSGAGAARDALPDLYFVRPGDTLRTIAAHLGVPDAALRLLDGAPPPAQTLQVGQPVQIGAPGIGSPSPSPGTTRRPIAPAPAAGGVGLPAGKIHVVAEGDTLTRIAARYGLTLRDLATLNGLEDPDLVKVGQVLRLSSAAATAPATGQATYTIRPGETVSHAAVMWGTTVEAVRRANGLADADFVEAGRVLVRPPV